MKTTKVGKVSFGNKTYKAEIPIICPYCGAYISPQLERNAAINFNSSVVGVVSFSSTCCENQFLVCYESENDSNAKLFYVYPAAETERISDEIRSISPRFCNLYNQASAAETLNFGELAGAGYRNALEVLIKDYAIVELGKSEEEVKNKKLFSAIGDYVPQIVINAADVVRVLGNDFTHYERRYEGIDLQVLKRYLQIFIQSIETQYLINHPVVPTNRT